VRAVKLQGQDIAVTREGGVMLSCRNGDGHCDGEGVLWYIRTFSRCCRPHLAHAKSWFQFIDIIE